MDACRAVELQGFFYSPYLAWRVQRHVIHLEDGAVAGTRALQHKWCALYNLCRGKAAACGMGMGDVDGAGCCQRQHAIRGQVGVEADVADAVMGCLLTVMEKIPRL